ncbi:hypothetical protein JCM5353_002618 [Sporobolomyces roseus]
MGSSSKRRDDDYYDDRSSRRDRRKSRSRSRSRKDKYDDYDDYGKSSSSSKRDKKYSDRDYSSSSSSKKYDDRDRRESSKSYDDYVSTAGGGDTGGRSGRREEERYQDSTYGGGGSTYDDRSSRAPPTRVDEYGSRRAPQSSYEQPYPPSQDPYGAPPLQVPQQSQYGSAPQQQNWTNNVPPASRNYPQEAAPPPQDYYARPPSSYSAPPQSNYGGQPAYDERPRDPYSTQQLSPGLNPPRPPFYGGSQSSSYGPVEGGRPQYPRAPASAPDTFRRDYAQSPMPQTQNPFDQAPPFPGPPPPAPPRAATPTQANSNVSEQWRAYYASQQAQIQQPPPSNYQLPPAPAPSTIPLPQFSPDLENGARGHWKPGENGQWTWVVIAQDSPVPPTQNQPMQFPPPPPSAFSPPSYFTNPPPPPAFGQPPIAPPPSNYPLYPIPPAPSDSAPPSTINPYSAYGQPPVQPAQPQYFPPAIASQPVLVQPQIPQMPPRAPSYAATQPVYQVVQPVELVQPVSAPLSRPRPSAPSVPAESDYSDDSRGRRRYEDDDRGYESDTGTRRRSRSRARRRSRSRSASRSRSRARDYPGETVEYDEKHYVKRSDGRGRSESYVEEPRHEDRRTPRRDPPEPPRLVRRIEVYDDNDDGRDGRDDRRYVEEPRREPVYEMRSLGKGQARRGSMNADLEKRKQLAKQIAEEEAEILQKRFSSTKISRRAEDQSDESWEKVEAPPRRARRNSLIPICSVVEEEVDPPQRVKPVAVAPKPAIDNAKASRIAAWSMAVPSSDIDTLSLDASAVARPRSAMKGGRAQAIAPVDDLDSVVEPFDPFAPVTTAQSASALYPSWQQSSRR